MGRVGEGEKKIKDKPPSPAEALAKARAFRLF